VDSGAQVNLVSQRFCEDNQQLWVCEDSVRLHFGNGDECATVGALLKLPLVCQGRSSMLDRVCVSPHDLGSIDLILGTPWLKQARAGVFVDPTPRVQFPDGGLWHSVEGLGTFNNSDADIRFVGGKVAQSFLRQNKGNLDVYAIRVGGDGPVKSAVVEPVKVEANRDLSEALAALSVEYDDVQKTQLPLPSERTGGEFLPESVMKIALKEGATPRRFRPIPLSHGESLVMKEIIAEMLDKQFIEESNNDSGWSAPVFLLRKPGNREGTACNKFRLLTDLRGANQEIKVESYFPPSVADLMRRLSGAKIFSAFDFLSGYQQLSIEEGSRPITTFSVHLPDKGLCFFRFTTCTLGLASAVGAFQTFAERVCNGLDKLGLGSCNVYIDDILLATAGDWRDHVKLVEAFLQRCRRYKVYLARSKCLWGVVHLDFLGFRISENSIEISEKKKEALKDFEVPRSFAQLRRFIGFCVYLSQHVPGFSGKIAPLTTLLKGDVKGAARKKFVWSSGCEDAFNNMREEILKASGLFIPNDCGQYSIEADASGMGVGAALFQTVDGVYRPVWFASHKLSAAEANYPSRSLEMLAVLFALKKFRGYIALTHVHVYSDHESLAGFLKQASLRGRDARWQELLGEFSFTQFYRKGELMLVADSLSRSQSELAAFGVTDFIEQESHPGMNRWHDCESPAAHVKMATTRAQAKGAVPLSTVDEQATPSEETARGVDTSDSREEVTPWLDLSKGEKRRERRAGADSLCPPAAVDPLWRQNLRAKCSLDDELVPIIRALRKEASTLSPEERATVRHFSVHDDGLYFQEGSGGPRLVIPRIPGDSTRTMLLFQAHEGVLHPGVEKTYANLARGFFWFGMRAAVERYVKCCLGCQQQKSKNFRAEGFRGGHSVPSRRWETVAVDFITGLQADSDGYDQVLVVMCTLTKFVYLVPSVSTDDAEQTAKRLFGSVFCVHGLPQRFQSDRDTRFCSAFFTQLMRCFRVSQHMGTSYDHRFNGIVENKNREVEVLLRSVLSQYQDRAFSEFLPLVAFAIKSSVHSSLKASPYFAMFGCEPSSPLLFEAAPQVRGDETVGVQNLVEFWR
jgi:hypothetical protein